MLSLRFKSLAKAGSAARILAPKTPSSMMTMMKMQNSKNVGVAGLVRQYSSGHQDETFEEFTERYIQAFDKAYDLFEVQRELNNCFSYDLVPAPVVIERALQACRRVNDYPTAVRTFEALKHKVETDEQYKAYLEELKEVRESLGIDLKENLF
ncbi:uncharacterized protein LODBEIA_P46160 [Lodderomyces beijingensis]|uniref:Cytochrome c oxidase subunit 6, mitochondrial n=1 Tax=Lodderomyces beijingensis TaxID=1775926 RepID=A0ABP0ZQJ0_9ASCO